jgi:superfamily II DNA/RNA helicase
LLKEDDEKILIFAYHLNLMDALSQLLNQEGVNFIRIDGSTKADIRNINVNRFQNDPSVRCAVLSIKATSAGLTLTSASKVVFAELDWTPSVILQAESRAHRIGQTRPVISYILIAETTADEAIWKKLIEKQKNLNKIGLIASNEHFNSVSQTAEPSSAVVKPLVLPPQNKAEPISDSTVEPANKKTESSDRFDDIDIDALLQAEQDQTSHHKAELEIQKTEESEPFDDIDMDALLQAENEARQSVNKISTNDQLQIVFDDEDDCIDDLLMNLP